MRFYGFNFQNAPALSRLFGPNVMANSRNAFNEGFGMFTPFDARTQARQYLGKVRNERLAGSQQSAQAMPRTGVGSAWVTPYGQVVQLQPGKTTVLSQGRNREMQDDIVLPERLYEDTEYMQRLGFKPFNFGNPPK